MTPQHMTVRLITIVAVHKVLLCTLHNGEMGEGGWLQRLRTSSGELDATAYMRFSSFSSICTVSRYFISPPCCHSPQVLLIVFLTHPTNSPRRVSGLSRCTLFQTSGLPSSSPPLTRHGPVHVLESPESLFSHPITVPLEVPPTPPHLPIKAGRKPECPSKY